MTEQCTHHDEHEQQNVTNVFIHSPAVERQVDRLEKLALAEFKKLNKKQERLEKKIMARFEQILSKMQEIKDAATSERGEVSAALQGLRDQITALQAQVGDVTPEQLTAFLTAADETLAGVQGVYTAETSDDDDDTETETTV